MKETFQVVEQMKAAGLIDDYSIAGAVGAIFYVEPFQTADIDFLVKDFDLNRFSDLIERFALEKQWKKSSLFSSPIQAARP